MCETGRQRTRYAYPPSPSPSSSRSRSSSRSPTRTLPLPARLRALQAELAALEAELEDPSNPALQAREKDGEGVDPGEMIRGLVDVRRRLEKVRRGREGRGRLVGVVVGEGEDRDSDGDGEDKEGEDDHDKVKGGTVKGSGDVPEARSIVEMDRRVGELEKLVGSVSATLDEVRAICHRYRPRLTRRSVRLRPSRLRCYRCSCGSTTSSRCLLNPGTSIPSLGDSSCSFRTWSACPPVKYKSANKL